jgi:hypothetical protein
MSLFDLRLTAFCLFALCAAGCASSPLGKLDASGESGDSILITGRGTLEEKEALLTDPDEIRQMAKLIDKVQRYRVIRTKSRWSFISETPSISLQIEHNGKSSKVSMISGQMRMPGDSIVFYGDDLETQAELWSLAMKHLGVVEDEIAAETPAGQD